MGNEWFADGQTKAEWLSYIYEGRYQTVNNHSFPAAQIILLQQFLVDN